VVAARLVAVYVAAVANAIFVQVALSGDDCHWMVPVFPARVNNVELVPAHTLVEAGVIEPATGAGLTLITTLVVFADEHGLLVTTAR